MEQCERERAVSCLFTDVEYKLMYQLLDELSINEFEKIRKDTEGSYNLVGKN